MLLGQILLCAALCWLAFDVTPSLSKRVGARWLLMIFCAAALLASFLPDVQSVPAALLVIVAAALAAWTLKAGRGDVWRLLEAVLLSALVVFVLHAAWQDELLYWLVRPEWFYGLTAGILTGFAAQHPRSVLVGAPIGCIVAELAYSAFVYGSTGAWPLWSDAYIDTLVIAAFSGAAAAALCGWIGALGRRHRKHSAVNRPSADA